MKTKVENYSRHPFNSDQIGVLKSEEFEPESGARAPFFEDAQDFVAQVGGKTVSAVVPGDILRDCWAGDATIPDGTTLVGWRTDKDARKRGRFAVRGMVVHRWERGGPTKLLDTEIEPTVENDFRTGEEFPYGGD